MNNKDYETTESRATYIAVGLKMAAQFKSDSFTDPIAAPEVTQVIQSNMLSDDGWFILQCFFNTLHPECGAIVEGFDPQADLYSLATLPNETMAAFFLRCTDLQNKFEISRGVPPIFRLVRKGYSLAKNDMKDIMFVSHQKLGMNVRSFLDTMLAAS